MRHRVGAPAPGPRAEVLVATTWRCNLRCSYCFVAENRLGAGGERMSPELARRIVDALDDGLPEVASICLHLYGGEPLTNLPAVEALVERAAERRPGRFSFAVTTNGTQGSARVFELLDRGRFQVILSLDGPAAIHDRCRRTAAGAATHVRVRSFLDELRARTRCSVRGSSVVRSGWRLTEAVAYLKGLPVDAIKAQAVRGAPGSAWSLTPEEKELYLEDLEALGEDVAADVDAGRAPRDDRFNHRVLQLLAGIERESFCAAGETTFGVTPTGEVLPCVLLDAAEHRLGYVEDEPATWRRAGQLWRAARPPRSDCASCSARALCGGGCPAILPVCGADECDLVRKSCDVAAGIYDRFRTRPERLLVLAGL